MDAPTQGAWLVPGPSNMDELRESSLLFSLESLLETERERVQREAREAERRREDELKRVAEAGERRRVAGQREREARERRRVLEQERERLDQDRIEAMKHATVERARIEAEAGMRLVEVEQARQHDLRLAKIREGQRTSQYRFVSWASASGLVAVLLGAGFAYFGMIGPAHARQEQQLQALLTVVEQRAKAGESVLSLERKKTRELEARISELKGQLDASQASAANPSDGKPNAARPGPTSGPIRQPLGEKTPGDKPCVDNGDPLNPTLCVKRKR